MSKDEKENKEKPISIRSLLLTSANITNNIVGAGIITLPHAFKDSGIGMGIIMLTLSCCACGWTFIIMAMCGEICETDSYEQTVNKLLGKYGFFTITVCTFIYPIICAASYGIAIADNLIAFFNGVAPSVTFLQYRFIVLFIPYFFIIFPLTMVKDMKFLEKFSTFSIFLVLLYSFVIISKLFYLPKIIQTLPNTFVFSKLTFIKALPIFAFACSCHHNVILFYSSMKNKSLKNLKLSKDVAFSFSLILYIIVAISGFISFGGLPSENIFINYCNNDILMNLMRIVFTLTLILTTPLQLFGAKQVILNHLLVKFKEKKYISLTVSLLLCSLCYLIASTLNNIGLVIELGGAISNVPIVYIFPAACAIVIYKKPFFQLDAKKILAWMILIFGIFMLVVSPAISIISYVREHSIKSIPKYYCYT